jgi:predicted regulator of Ras-like GTPase activity (Roadblock/LC7/MglB family)
MVKSATRKGKTAVPVPAPAPGAETQKLRRLLSPLLKEIGARWVMLVGMDGRPIAEHGHAATFDPLSLAPIMAASLGSMRQMARHFGGEYSVMVNHGKRENVQLSIVGEKMILAIVFGNQAPVGSARLAAQQVTRKLEELLEEDRPRSIGTEFAARVKSRLDDLLG